MTDSAPSPELQRIMVEAANAVRPQARAETLAGLQRVEEALGYEVAITMAVEIAGAALQFAAERAKSDEERRAVADGIKLIANSVLMHNAGGHA